MNTEDKTYFLLGEKIVRKYHYVDAHHHYDYITKGKTFTSLAKAKEYIRDCLYNGRKPQEP